MYYLSAYNRGLFKSYYCYVLFLQFDKSFRPYEKNFWFYLSIFFKKNFLVNKYKKQRCYRENKSPFFDVMKNGNIFPAKVCHFQYDDRFLFSREMENIRRRYVWKDLLNFDCQNSICFAFFRLFKNDESFGKSFSYPFSAKCFHRNFKCFLFCTFQFLNVAKFEDSKHIKRYIFHYCL